MVAYQLLMHEAAYQGAADYYHYHRNGSGKLGAYLRRCIGDRDIAALSINEFIGQLLNTKRPQIFAESEVAGDGRDWNQTELSILGDIAVAVPVTVYDDGLHRNPTVHAEPFEAGLLYAAGALLRNGQGFVPADWAEVTSAGEINVAAYYGLYERRLLPAFLYANGVAKSMNKAAFITIPGMGCGQFAGEFQGQLGEAFRKVLVQLLRHFSSRLPYVRAVYYDPYSECANDRMEIEQISFLVRPLRQGNDDKPQLCRPAAYEEGGDDFAACHLFSFVAWDHVSWPGNDFYLGSRATDDGVKAAATNSMAVMTGVEGSYSRRTRQYDPPMGYNNWEQVVRKNEQEIRGADCLFVAGDSDSALRC